MVLALYIVKAKNLTYHEGTFRRYKMKKIWLAIAGVVVLVGMLAMAGCGTSASPNDVNVNLNSQQTGLWVNGEGKVTVTPDVAIINIGIETQEVSVADAQAKAAEAMDKLMQALKAQGVKEKDIQTTGYYISQVTRWDNERQIQEVTGYRVSNTVTVKVRDVAKAGATIDAVAAAGGDLTRVNGITFTVDDPTNYYNDARDKAIANAKAKAEQMASKSGAKLGKITYITENNYYSPIYRSYDSIKASGAAPEAAPTAISAGELEVTTTVQIAYALD
jgi:uncharacterized protein